MLRRAFPAVLALLLAAGWLTAPRPAAAWTPGACPSTAAGVTVVVDFSAFGGGVVTRCSPGAPATGFAALTGAGFATEQVRNVPGFICRIDGRPGADREPCINTPPGDAYWTYWNAQRGGSWSYSQSGGGSRRPPVGSVEGWAFAGPGGAKPPSIAPPAPPAPVVTPRPTPRPTVAPPPPAATPRPAPATPRPSAQPATPDPATDTPRPQRTTRATPTDSPTPEERPDRSGESAARPVPPSSASPGGQVTTEVTEVTDAAPASDERPDEGGLIGFFAGAALVALLGVTALTRARRRAIEPEG